MALTHCLLRSPAPHAPPTPVSDIADRAKLDSIASELQLDSLQPALLHRRIMKCTPDRLVDFTSEFLLIDLTKLDGHCGRLFCVH
jgi:hypothetical protein